MTEQERLEAREAAVQRYFKTTAEPYDSLEWDGDDLQVVLDGETIEEYSLADLREMIDDFQ